MPQWGNTDDANNAPKYLEWDDGNAEAANNVYFVDTDEAAVANNRANGLKTPGWTIYEEYGSGRKRVEVLVPMKVSAADAGDLGITGNTTNEDTVVED